MHRCWTYSRMPKSINWCSLSTDLAILWSTRLLTSIPWSAWNTWSLPSKRAARRLWGYRRNKLVKSWQMRTFATEAATLSRIGQTKSLFRMMAGLHSISQRRPPLNFLSSLSRNLEPTWTSEIKTACLWCTRLLLMTILMLLRTWEIRARWASQTQTSMAIRQSTMLVRKELSTRSNGLSVLAMTSTPSTRTRILLFT